MAIAKPFEKRFARSSAFGGINESLLSREIGKSGISRVKKEASARRAEKKARKKKRPVIPADFKSARIVIDKAFNKLKK